LQLEERAGMITQLRRQISFDLLPSQPRRKEFTRTERAVKYIADFVYIRNGVLRVEDVKGVRTREYIIKRKLMRYIHHIEIEEI